MQTSWLNWAHDRFEIADTIYRYAFGLDHGDPDSLASAFTEDCVIDFSSAAKKLGLQFPIVRGRDRVVEILIPMLGPLDASTLPAICRSKSAAKPRRCIAT